MVYNRMPAKRVTLRSEQGLKSQWVGRAGQAWVKVLLDPLPQPFLYFLGLAEFRAETWDTLQSPQKNKSRGCHRTEREKAKLLAKVQGICDHCTGGGIPPFEATVATHSWGRLSVLAAWEWEYPMLLSVGLEWLKWWATAVTKFTKT